MRIVLMGPPGAGKGSQAVLLKEKYGIPHISTGDIFRVKMKDGSELGNKAKSFVEKGDLVPDEIVVAMVKERLEEADTKGGYILDGFPRTRAQAEALDLCLRELGGQIDYVLDFDLDDEIIVKRLAGRRVCPECASVYHVTNVAPKKEGICDQCGNELIQRKDDAEATVRNRLNVYHETADPLKEYYLENQLLHPVDGGMGTEALSAVLDDLLKT